MKKLLFRSRDKLAAWAANLPEVKNLVIAQYERETKIKITAGADTLMEMSIEQFRTYQKTMGDDEKHIVLKLYYTDFEK